MASAKIRERWRTLRDRNLVVRQAVWMKNKIAVLLMDTGVRHSYNVTARTLKVVETIFRPAGIQPWAAKFMQMFKCNKCSYTFGLDRRRRA